ncbi:MAG TPA: amidase [Terracidiphilus sp.]|jgi:aspartyl-tRNA(Asn)/glutamyl-tRNA(Gln) amidotransferase subunit A
MQRQNWQRTISRREFAAMCGGALAVGSILASRPAIAGATITSNAAADASEEDLTALTLAEASARIHNRTVTSTQLTKALLARIDIYNPKVDCYITVMSAEALKQAAQLDEEQKAGKFRGPLHGIPIALKDNIDTAGTRTTAASPMFRTRVPSEDAEIVRRLKASGAIILGKLNLHEFALGCTGDVSYFGPSRNPWALDRVTGGSSSGSGAAVAADLCYAALGTDTGGSIRVPSSWCGIVGIKPTTGLVSIRGIIPCLASLDHCGPMARTVDDVALMLTEMAGYDNLDIFSVEHPREDYTKSMKQPVAGFRLGAPVEFYDHLDPEVAAAVSAACELLAKLTKGITSRATLPNMPEGENFYDAIGDAASYHEPLIKESGMNYMPPTVIDMQSITKVPSAADSARSHDKLVMIRRTVDAAFSDIDLVVVPTTTSLPAMIKDSLAEEMRDRKPKHAYDFFNPTSGCTNTAPFDVYGIPALSLPCGFSKDGLPIGLMIAGPHFAEGKVLALAYAFQQATDWQKRKPNLTPDTQAAPIVEADKDEPKHP